MEKKHSFNADDDKESGESENIIINEVDGLPNMHPNFDQLEYDFEEKEDCSDVNTRTFDDLVHDEDLPMSIIVTNVDPHVFKCDNSKISKHCMIHICDATRRKANIEKLFKEFGEVVTFQYFKSFRRMRVNFTSPSSAAHARIKLHQSRFGDTDINCYFAQPVTPIDMEDQYLQPPALTKQYLISPPASPPVGWEPRPEGEPLVNHDLLAAIANLTPGAIHELHRGGSGQPGIVVHVCETSNSINIKSSTRLQPTHRPEH